MFDSSPDGLSIYPEYLSDPKALVCPPDSAENPISSGKWYVNNARNGTPQPCRFDAHSYGYFSWAITDDLIVVDPTQKNDKATTPDNVFAYLRPDVLVKFSSMASIRFNAE